MAITQENLHESELLSQVISALREEYDTDIYITDTETNDTPPKFPAIVFYRSNNRTLTFYQTLDSLQRASSVQYCITVYSQDGDEAKSIVNTVDVIMDSIGFVRTDDRPIFNVDTTIYRRYALWEGTIILD